MITFDQFIAKYNGQYVDFDGRYGYQCVDLMRFYIKEVLGYPVYDAVPSVGYAKEIFAKANPAYFEKITNTPTNFPNNGDIVVWKPYPFVIGWAGHVAINITGAPLNLISFDQNFNVRWCHRQLHNYKGVIGWLRPRKK